MPTNRLDPKDIQSLQQLHDELKVRVHLLKMEAKEEWEKLEKDWEKLKGRVSLAGRDTAKSAGEVAAAGDLFLESLKEGYERIKRSLPH